MMRRIGITVIGALAASVAIVQITHAQDEGWGPTGRVSLVTTGAQLVSRDLSFPLSRYHEYIRQGAQLENDAVLELHPGARSNLLGVIEEEIYLLQAVRSGRLDPYFAYRLGILGQLVADATAPLANASSSLRRAYFDDAESYIRQAQVAMEPRRVVDATYFPARRRAAAVNDGTIRVDYQSGVGFSGLAAAVLPADAGRCVNAIADVIYTIVVAPVSRLNVSQGDMRDYTLGALEYYLAENKLTEAAEAVENVLNLGVVTPELHQRIGTVYFDAGHYDRAIMHYESALEADPSRREIAARIASYYQRVGQEARENGFLEDALAAYTKATEANLLNEEAQLGLLNTQRDITARSARFEAQKSAIALAEDYQSRAEADTLSRNYIQAMAHLREAEAHYQSVSDEFPDLARTAGRGYRKVTFEIKELREQVVANVQRLSGTGFAHTARGIAARTDSMRAQAVRSLVATEVSTALEDFAEATSQDIENLR